MRVLVADDEHYIRDLLQRCLRSWGYEVCAVEDGDSAWAILERADAPRVLIIDWDMPGLKGPEVVRLVRESERGHEVYVVMLTGRVKKTDLIAALEAGVDDYLTKPFNARELQLRLARATAARREREARLQPAPLPAAAADESVLAGRYRIERRIGEGGMADVWLGTHLALEIPIAVKFMKPEMATQQTYPSFEREARAAAKLRSEHILHVYDHGITPGRVPYLVMEYLPGESLAHRVIQRGPLEPAAVGSILTQIARALASAHERRIVHGDVKPENIVLVEHRDWPHGLAKLVDFGLARSASTARVPGEVLSGTPSYMSPEHLCGAEPSPALDVWGLAATAFTAVTGSCAYDADSLPALVHRVCNLPPPRATDVNPRLPPALDRWFTRAFARDPARRFRWPSEIAASFTKAYEQGGGDDSQPPPPRRSREMVLSTELLVDLELQGSDG